MPADLTASAGIDVLSHAVEGYWSRLHQPICDVLAVYAAKLVLTNIRTVYKDPNNQAAREKMAAASLIAGEACGLTLDFFIRLNGTKDFRTRELTSQLGFYDYEQFADAVQRLKRDLHLRTNLTDLHINEEKKEELIRLSHHANLKNNPVEVTDEDLRRLYDGLCD